MHKSQLLSAAVPLASVVGAALLLSNCTPGQSQYLIFVQTESVGITVSGGTTNLNPQFSIGYNDVDAAIIPVAVASSLSGSAGLSGSQSLSGQQPIGGYMPIFATRGLSGQKSDTLSVFGQFEVNASESISSASPSAKLGKFFATGIAAEYLAQGFKNSLSAGLSGSGKLSE